MHDEKVTHAEKLKEASAKQQVVTIPLILFICHIQ